MSGAEMGEEPCKPSCKRWVSGAAGSAGNLHGGPPRLPVLMSVSSGRVMWVIPGKLASAGWMVSRYVSWGTLSFPQLGLLQPASSHVPSPGMGHEGRKLLILN